MRTVRILAVLALLLQAIGVPWGHAEEESPEAFGSPVGRSIGAARASSHESALLARYVNQEVLARLSESASWGKSGAVASSACLPRRVSKAVLPQLTAAEARPREYLPASSAPRSQASSRRPGTLALLGDNVPSPLDLRDRFWTRFDFDAMDMERQTALTIQKHMDMGRQATLTMQENLDAAQRRQSHVMDMGRQATLTMQKNLDAAQRRQSHVMDMGRQATLTMQKNLDAAQRRQFHVTDLERQQALDQLRWQVGSDAFMVPAYDLATAGMAWVADMTTQARVLAATGDLAAAHLAGETVGAGFETGSLLLGGVLTAASTIQYVGYSAQVLSPDPYAVNLPSAGLRAGLAPFGRYGEGTYTEGSRTLRYAQRVVTSTQDHFWELSPVITTRHTLLKTPYGYTETVRFTDMTNASPIDRFMTRHFATSQFEPFSTTEMSITASRYAWRETTVGGVTNYEPSSWNPPLSFDTSPTFSDGLRYEFNSRLNNTYNVPRIENWRRYLR